MSTISLVGESFSSVLSMSVRRFRRMGMWERYARPGRFHTTWMYHETAIKTHFNYHLVSFPVKTTFPYWVNTISLQREIMMFIHQRRRLSTLTFCKGSKCVDETSRVMANDLIVWSHQMKNGFLWKRSTIRIQFFRHLNYCRYSGILKHCKDSNDFSGTQRRCRKHPELKVGGRTVNLGWHPGWKTQWVFSFTLWVWTERHQGRVNWTAWRRRWSLTFNWSGLAAVTWSHLFCAVTLQQIIIDVSLKHRVSLFTRKWASESLKKNLPS